MFAIEVIVPNPISRFNATKREVRTFKRDEGLRCKAKLTSPTFPVGNINSHARLLTDHLTSSL